MKEEIYNYLLSELHPCPSCDTCQYSDRKEHWVPCKDCGAFSNYKLSKAVQQDTMALVRGIMKIVKRS